MYKYIVTKDGIERIKMTQEEIEDQGGDADVDEPKYELSIEEQLVLYTDYLLDIDLRVMMLELTNG